MRRSWGRMIDQLAQDAIGDGDVSRLPGAGKPLRFEGGAHTPADMRAAFKIMQDHNVIPDWIAMGQTLEERETELRQQVIKRAARYRQTLQTSQTHARRTWQQYVKEYTAEIEGYNRQARLYNLKVPAGLPHRRLLDSRALISAALDDGHGDE